MSKTKNMAQFVSQHSNSIDRRRVVLIRCNHQEAVRNRVVWEEGLSDRSTQQRPNTADAPGFGRLLGWELAVVYRRGLR